MRSAFVLMGVCIVSAACGVAGDPTGFGNGSFGSQGHGGGGSNGGGFGGSPGGPQGGSGGGPNGGSNGGGGGGSSGGPSSSSSSSSGGPSQGSSSSGGSGGQNQNDGGPSGNPTTPKTVADLVSLANSLRQPVTIAEFIAALPHPLALNATSSQFSLQPAVDQNNPRIFIVIGNLVLSVVPTGPDVNTLEIGDMSNGMMSPAQLSFPITSTVTDAAPYQAVLAAGGNGTVCARCHDKHFGNEVQLTTVSGTPVYGMGQIPPFPQFDVPVTTLISLAQSCDPSADKERCDIFTALTSPSLPTQYTF